MPSQSSHMETWRYLVHEGRVFCPLAVGDVEVVRCLACPHRRSPATDGSGSASVECLPPPGARLSSRISAIAGADR